MYTVVIGRQSESIAFLQSLFPAEAAYLQAGGNETVGQGWFALTVHLGRTGPVPTAAAQPGAQR